MDEHLYADIFHRITGNRKGMGGHKMTTYKVMFDGFTFIVELTESEKIALSQDEEITIMEVIG